jgi:hypothetical protein
VVVLEGDIVALVVVVKAASEYHWIVDPAAQVPVKVADEPLQILGAFKPVGATGSGLIITGTLAVLRHPFPTVYK